MTVTTATMGTLTTAGTPPAMPGIGTIPRGSLRLLLLRARAAEAGGIDIATGITRAEAEAGGADLPQSQIGRPLPLLGGGVHDTGDHAVLQQGADAPRERAVRRRRAAADRAGSDRRVLPPTPEGARHRMFGMRHLPGAGGTSRAGHTIGGVRVDESLR